MPIDIFIFILFEISVREIRSYDISNIVYYYREFIRLVDFMQCRGDSKAHTLLLIIIDSRIIIIIIIY